MSRVYVVRPIRNYSSDFLATTRLCRFACFKIHNLLSEETAVRQNRIIRSGETPWIALGMPWKSSTQMGVAPARNRRSQDYKPSHICLNRIRQQPRYSIPRKFSAYRSYRTTSLRKFCNQANSLSIFQRLRYRRRRLRSCVLFLRLLRCGEISSIP